MSDKNNSNEFTVINLFKLFWYRKVLIVVFVASFSVLVFGYSMIAPVEYEAAASIMPPDENSGNGSLSGFLQSLQGSISIGSMGQANKSSLLSEILQSRSLAKYIADTLDLYKEEKFKEMDSVLVHDFVTSLIDYKMKRSGLISLVATYSSGYFPSSEEKQHTAELSAMIANTAIEGVDYISRNKNVSKARRKGQFIQRMLDKKKKELDSVDAELEKFREEHKVMEIDEQTQAIIKSAVSVGYDLAQAEIEYNMMLQEFNPESPAMRGYEQQLKTLRQQYRKIQTGGLMKDDEFSIPFTKVPSLIRQYTNLMRDQKILNQVNLYLETQKYQEAIQEASDIPTVEALDKAITPIFKSAPSKMFMLLIGGVLSTFFILLFITIHALVKGNLKLKAETE